MHYLIIASIVFSNFISAQQLKQPLYNAHNLFVKRSNIAIISYFAPGSPYEAFLEPLVDENKRKYAETNGYDYINPFDHEDMQKDYLDHRVMHFYPAPHYYKLRLIPYLFRKYNYQWIMWADGDAIFLNHSQRLEPHLDSDYDVILTSDPTKNAKWAKIINTGHFFVKNSPWSIKFFYQAYGLSFANCMEYLAGKPLINGWLNMCESREKFLLADQRILQYYISYAPHNIYGCHFKHVHFFNFNSEFPYYQPGDLVVHFPGKKIDEKVKLIKSLIANSNYAGGTVAWENDPALKPSDQQNRAPAHEFDSVNQKCSK